MPPIPGLNTRETALAAWLVAFFVFALTKSDIRRSMGSMLRVFFGSGALTGMLASAAAYATGTVLLLRYLGYWGDHMTKTAALWFIGIGLVALFNTGPTNGAYFRRLALHNVALVIIVEFVVNLHTFPLLIELVLVPLALLLAGTQAVAESNPEFAQARKLIAWCLTVLGLTSLSFSLAYLAADFNRVATVEKIEEFLLPLILTVCFIPFLYAVRMFTAYQTMLCMIRFGLHDNEALYRFARRLIVRSCGLSLSRAQLFEERFRGRLLFVEDEAEVTRVVDEFRQASKTWRSRGVSQPGPERPGY
ncbi:MAG: hypothetical protein ABSB96_05120 [Gaiellaceae bacterium]